jgi:predicted AAA+ superfamily ATPase
LMKNISETLARRIAILELLPFCLKEVARLDSLLENTIWTGLFPEPACFPGKRDLWVKSYIQTYLERDIRQLEAIRDFRSFELFVGLCAAFHSQEFRPAELARNCGVSQPTIKSWSKLLEASYFALLLPPFFKNYGKRLIRTSKFYFTDPAFVCYLTRQPSGEAALSGNMGGALFEGLVVTETYKAFFNAGQKPSVFFWRSQGGLEVDLIVQAKAKLWPVEIKLTSTPRAESARSLDRFKTLVGKEASEQGLVVCRVREKTSLPGVNVALPWRQYPEWLKDIV